jgi:hypothetical protein
MLASKPFSVMSHSSLFILTNPPRSPTEDEDDWAEQHTLMKGRTSQASATREAPAQAELRPTAPGIQRRPPIILEAA